MSEDRTKAVWPWIVAVMLGLPALFVASFGPGCCLADSEVLDIEAVAKVYAPIIRLTPTTAAATRGARSGGGRE